MHERRGPATTPDRRAAAEGHAVAWNGELARALIAVPSVACDKYSRGVLGMITGSAAYPGAAVLGVEAAIRTGVGMVRYVGDDAATAQVLAHRPEAVPGEGRVQAWLMGSGMDTHTRGEDVTTRLRRALATDVPVVLDAGALDLVRQAVGPAVILPHARELARLLTALGAETLDAPDGTGQDGTGQDGTGQDGTGLVGTDQVSTDQVSTEQVSAEQVSADPIGWAHRAARLTGAVVLLKGSRTVVASETDGVASTILLPAATPWLATAGTGDVLGGIIGALVATHADTLFSDPSALAEIAATGALIHALAAAEASGGGPIAALDVAQAVPGRIAALLA